MVGTIIDELTGLPMPPRPAPRRHPGSLAAGAAHGDRCLRVTRLECADCHDAPYNRGFWEIWHDLDADAMVFVHRRYHGVMRAIRMTREPQPPPYVEDYTTRHWTFEVWHIQKTREWGGNTLGCQQYLHTHEVHPPLRVPPKARKRPPLATRR